jgi:hypothetical protein
MAKIINRVGSLSVLRKEFDKRNITQFHSIKDISEFERTYQDQLEKAGDEIRRRLQSEMDGISAELQEAILSVSRRQSFAEEEVNSQNASLETRLASLQSQGKTGLLGLMHRILASLLRRRIRLIQNSRSTTIEKYVGSARMHQAYLDDRYNEIHRNFDRLLQRDVDAHVRTLNHTRTTIDELRPLILGSIGESMVSSTLSGLPDGYVAINDFHVELYKPIFYPSEDDRIFSFQIDHVVVGPGGVFAIETKHWSNDSIANYDLFSPVKQVRRSGYALFRILNDGSIGFGDHWGERAVSVHNVIVFTAKQVKERYKFVRLLDLANLNGYIQGFDEALKASDVERIVSYLTSRCIQPYEST